MAGLPFLNKADAFWLWSVAQQCADFEEFRVRAVEDRSVVVLKHSARKRRRNVVMQTHDVTLLVHKNPRIPWETADGVVQTPFLEVIEGVVPGGEAKKFMARRRGARDKILEEAARALEAPPLIGNLSEE